jgi:uncharacterized membrane protein YuzA (DUF378 family)
MGSNVMSVKIKMLATVLVLVGGLNWGLTALNFNLVEKLAQLVKYDGLSNIVYLLVGVSALYLTFDRNVYLPFLGKTVFPSGLLQESVPSGADTKANVHTTPDSVVVYWASEPSNEVVGDPYSAYEGYKNAGVTMSDSQGVAMLSVRSPSAYKVGREKQLSRHIHYRTYLSKGMLGEVQTVYI